MNMAERIQELRKQRGYSQEELAEKVGVSRQAVSKWESEQSMPDLDKIIALSEIFGVTTDHLLKGTEMPPAANRKTNKALYIGCASAFAVMAGIWTFTANRFRFDECVWIALAAGVVGFSAAAILQAIKGMKME